MKRSDSTRPLEEVRMMIPKTLKNVLSFEERGDFIIITPLQFLGSENFNAVATIVHGMNGEYSSSGKAPHFKVLRRQV